jgi:uncharacterized protein
MTALRGLKGLVVIDEVQRKPDLFTVLRVLADRRPLTARFLILGSASPELLRQSAESLAGRIETVAMSGFSIGEVGISLQARHWIRGGFLCPFLHGPRLTVMSGEKILFRRFWNAIFPSGE